MKIGPDGSLCRITSSAKDLINNVKIVKIPDSVPSYKLVLIEPHDECEELSEKSDDEEEIFDDLLCEFPSKNIEKEKIIDTKIEKHDKPSETERKGFVNQRNYNNRGRSRGSYRKKNNYEHYERNNFKKISRKCENLSNREEIYNYGNRDFNSAVNHAVAYNTSKQHSSEDYSPSPWLDPPVMHQNYACTPFSHVAPLPTQPRNSRGLLGDCPAAYSRSLPHIQSNEQNDIREQSSSYFPVSSNAASDFQSNTPTIRNQPYHPMSNFSANEQSNIHEQSPSYLPVNSNAASNFQSNTSNIRNQPYHPMSNFSTNKHDSSFIHNQKSYPQRTNYKSNKRTGNFIHHKRYHNDRYSNYNNNNQQHGNKNHMNNKNQTKRKDWDKKPRRPNFPGENY